jgi:GNAT superfamily N-acetyltransferase
VPDIAAGAGPARVLLLDGATAAALRPMTFPAFRWLLENARAEGPVFAFALSPPEVRRVTGLALVRREGGGADLLSLFIAPPQRGQGYTRRLLDVAEATLAAGGVEALGAHFDARSQSGAQMCHILQSRGWDGPALSFLSFKSDFAHALKAPWMRARVPPTGTVIVPWSKGGENYSGRIADPDLVPRDLDPSRYVPHAHDGAPLEPAGSFALLAGDSIVGWILCHRIHSRDCRITASYIHPRYEGRFGSGPLWRAAILGLHEAGYGYALWSISARYPRSVAFARRHSEPIALWITEMVRMSKRLRPAPA